MFVTHEPRHDRGERGQALILFVGIFSVVLVLAAIVVDFGLWFAERRSAQRGADLAAAAGALDLPADNGTDAFISACDWAIRNGFDFADADVEVEVDVFARGAPATPVSCSEATPALACGSDCNRVRVTVRKGAPRLFTGLFGLGEFDVGAEAVAGLTYGGGGGGIGGVGADQTVLLIDAQGRMGHGFAGENCGTNPQACPIGNERSAATALVDTLLGLDGNGEVGYAAYNNCYGPTSGPLCLQESGPNDVVIEPTRIRAELLAGIAATATSQQQPANICTGLWQASELFQNAPGSRQVLVLMSDGGNVDYRSSTYSGALGNPPGECLPLYPVPSGPTSPCDPTRPAERELDSLTLQMATYLKDEKDVEIYVIALNPCAWAADPTLPPVDNPWPTDCDPLAPAHDNDADQRLLMCIATSPEHYQRVNNVAELPDTIEDIASEIVSRSLLQ